MREIKFRAWAKDHKKMFIVGDMHWSAKLGWSWNATKAKTTFYGTGELMQYTGLKDKNGVEIYEGDIMLQPAGAPENEDSYMVVKFGDTGDSCWGFWLDGCLSGSFIDVFTSHEVIGNVHQNPELLK